MVFETKVHYLLIPLLLLVLVIPFVSATDIPSNSSSDSGYNTVYGKLEKPSDFIKLSPLIELYHHVHDKFINNKYWYIIIPVVLILILWILAIPSRIAIELAGRLIGVNPDVGNFGALFLTTMMSLNGLVGLIFFMIWFKDEMETYKVVILAILSMILLGLIDLILIGITIFVLVHFF